MSNEQTQSQQFDVVISGGGLSGSLMALSLASLKDHQQQPLRIAIIEANPILTDASRSFDDRVLALSHGSAQYLQQVKAWQHFASQAQPIENIHISDRGHYGKARLYAKTHQVQALGYVAEMSAIGAALLKQLKQHSNISWFAPNKIETIKWQQSKVDIGLDDQQQLSASLLLACDGAQSPCRKLANIGVSEFDYQQSALIANVATSKAHHNIAYERFTEQGPIAMLPLGSLSGQGEQGRCSLVWSLTPELAAKKMALSESAFARELEQAFGHWLGNVTQVGKRVVYPLKLLQAKEQVFHRMALVGNASHTIHPIAGQGFNLGLRDVAQLTSLIAKAWQQGQDIGQMQLLMQYGQNRQLDHQQVITLTDSLVTLFSNDLPPMIVGRNIGLKVLNYLSPLKNALVKKTMGY